MDDGVTAFAFALPAHEFFYFKAVDLFLFMKEGVQITFAWSLVL